MAELKGNSFKDREATETEHKFEKVVTNPTEIRPKNEAKKLAGMLGPDIIGDVVKPAIKETVSDVVAHLFDMVEDAIRMQLFPDGGGGRKKRGRYGGETVSYGGYYRSGRDRERKYASARSAFDVEDVVFRTRGEAEKVLWLMEDAIDHYGVVTVGDFYDMSDISTMNMPHTMHKYGWTDVDNASVKPVRGGFIIKFPRPMPIDQM